MKKKWWLILIAVVIGIQLIRPGHNVPAPDPALDFQAVATPPNEVLKVLKSACYDCHSYDTKNPWYAQIAPVSWWVTNHVNEGREKLNFSTFGALSASDRAEAAEETVETLREKEMPLQSYTWMHPEARLTDDQRNLLIGWFEGIGGGSDGEE